MIPVVQALIQYLRSQQYISQKPSFTELNMSNCLVHTQFAPQFPSSFASRILRAFNQTLFVFVHVTEQAVDLLTSQQPKQSVMLFVKSFQNGLFFLLVLLSAFHLLFRFFLFRGRVII